MTNAEATSLTREPALSPLESLRRQLSGDILLPGDETYQVARQMISFSHNNFPAVIVKAATNEDVALGVRFAREHGIPLSVRSGGHSVAGHSVIDGAVTIDLTGMKGVTIDPETRLARVQGGARSVDLAWPANQLGLALSTGDTGSVGLGGLVTGGGIGYFVRKYGIAADRLRSATIVTADGDIITASANVNPDLFWAIRGGGGNFGIIVEFEFELVPVETVYAGALILPATREVVRGYLDYAADAPEDLTTIATMVHVPPAPFVPEHRIGESALLILAVFDGDEESGKAAMAPLRALGEPIADTLSMVPYPAIFQYMEWAEAQHGGDIRMLFTDEIPDSTIDDFIDAMDKATSPFAGIHLRGLGGAFARVPRESTAFVHRDRKYFVAILGVYMDPADDPEVHSKWTQDIWSKISHLSQGVYVNFLQDEGESRIRDAYPGIVHERLAAVKAKYDPDNVFRHNQNIRPASDARQQAA